MKESNMKKYINFLFICGYSMINAIFIYFHEPWRDEAQVWLLARDLPVWKLPVWMSYEGHPCLWHFMVCPFAKLGFPYITLNIISLVVMVGAVTVLLYKGQFPVYIKLAIVFSPICMYWYPVVARNYCLIALFLFLLATYFPERKERPFLYTALIALLVQTHVIMIMTAFVLSACFGIEGLLEIWRIHRIDSKRYVDIVKSRGKWCTALLLPLFSAAFLTFQMMNIQSSSLLVIDSADLFTVMKKIWITAVKGIQSVIGGVSTQGNIFLFTGLLLLIIFAVKKKNCAEKWTAFFTISCTFLFQFWMYAMAYRYSKHRLIALVLVIIWGMWINWEDKNKINSSFGSVLHKGYQYIVGLLLSIVCILALVHDYHTIMEDISEPYSNGKGAAAFIEENIQDNAVIMTDAQPECSSVFPYLEKKDFLYAPNGDRYTFVTLDDRYNMQMEYDDFIKYAAEFDSGGKPIYLISAMGHSCIRDAERLPESFALLYQSPYASLKEEDYQIYILRK